MERRRLGADLYAVVAPELERRGFLAAFTERTGGTSSGPYRSLNLGFGTGDRPATVRRNRGLAAVGLKTPGFHTAHQVHGSRVLEVKARPGTPSEAERGQADILVTTARRVPVAVLGADCLPVVIASEAEARLVVVHAGWRGLAAGIVGRAAALFGDPGRAVAAVGPGIGPCHYEVGSDVVEAVAAGSPGAVSHRGPGRPYLDLAATAENALIAAGVEAVEVAGICTACEKDRFFSHRRDGRTGRQAGVAMRL